MEQVIERLKKLDTTCVSDAMDRLGVECCLLNIKPIQFGQKICGRAFTVQYVSNDVKNGTVGDFLDDVQPGQIIVLDNAGREDCTVWGDIMSRTAKKNGIAGTVINGVCRDVAAVLACSYPVFSKGYYMRTGKDRVCAEAVNVPIKISNIPVFPGDIVFGDDNGVIVIPNSIAGDVVQIAEEIDRKEQLILDLVSDGRSLKEARQMTGYHQFQSREK